MYTEIHCLIHVYLDFLTGNIIHVHFLFFLKEREWFPKCKSKKCIIIHNLDYPRRVTLSVYLTHGGMSILEYIVINNYGMRSVEDTISAKLRKLMKLNYFTCRQMFLLLIVRDSRELKWLEC